MTRSLCWLPALVLVFCIPRLSSAQGMTATISQNGQTLSIGSKIWIHENNNVDLVQPATTPTSLQHYFNYAHCVCSEPGVSIAGYNETTFSQEIDSSGGTPYHIPMELWVGADCMTPTNRPIECTDTGVGVSDIATLETSVFTKPEISVFEMMTPEPMSTTCQQRVLSAAEWGLLSAAMSGMPDTFLSNAVDTDSQPPPIPTSFTASGAESAVEIDWTAATGNVADVAYYQVLCADSNGNPAFATPPVSPRYATPRTLCGQPEDVCLTASDVSGTPPVVDAGVAPTDAGADGGVAACATNNLPTGLAQLDPTFLCAETTTPTATNIRVNGLTNGQPYTVVLLTIDLSGNAAGTYFTSALTPKPVTDFWEDLQGRCTGDNCPQGGFCLLADTYGDDSGLTNVLRSFRDDNLGSNVFGRALTHAYYAAFAKLGSMVRGHLVRRIISAILLAPFVAIALAWHVLGLPLLLLVLGLIAYRRRIGRRLAWRKHKSAVAATVVAIALFAMPGRAHAQTPYWDQQTGDGADTDSMAEQPTDVKWHAGVRVGPYTPGIDSQSGLTPGPYKQMFGGAKVMPTIDVERFLWTGFGQLGIGLSIGYLGTSANAWLEGSSPTDPDRPRSTGDTNSFHLIPIQLTAVYRFTYFDDAGSVPIVPYVRAGFAYDPWWVTAPDGDFATACPGVGMVAAGCTSTTAAGASPGIVGSIGLAIRAERIDSSAAMSMRESGIEHAGVYFELDAGKVDGLGIVSHRLSVGDTTYAGGVDFEF